MDTSPFRRSTPPDEADQDGTAVEYMVVEPQELMLSFGGHAAGPSPGEEAELRSSSEEQEPEHQRSEPMELYTEAQRVVWVASGEILCNELLLSVENSETRELVVDDRTSSADCVAGAVCIVERDMLAQDMADSMFSMMGKVEARKLDVLLCRRLLSGRLACMCQIGVMRCS